MLQVCRYGGMELWRRAAGVMTWRYGALEARQCSDMDVWRPRRSGGALQAWRSEGIDGERENAGNEDAGL